MWEKVPHYEHATFSTEQFTEIHLRNPVSAPVLWPSTTKLDEATWSFKKKIDR